MSKSIAILMMTLSCHFSQIKELNKLLPLESTSSTDAQKATTPIHPSIPLLLEILQEFRDDELEHLDVAVENEAQLTPGHALLSAVVGAGCRMAIGVAAKI